MADLTHSLERLQFSRYKSRGGRLSHEQLEQRRRDHRFNSPNIHNMAPGQPYRKWFLRTISRTHYSLGEATEYYNRWLEDPSHGPNGPHPPFAQHTSLTHTDFRSDHREHQYYIAPPPPPTDSDEDSTPDTPRNNNFAQSHVEDILVTQNDTTAILDSGAMMTTATRRHLALHQRWIDNLRPAPPGTAIRYGNMETEPVDEQGQIGSYQLSVVPDRFRTALICVHDIVNAGHTVSFNQHYTIISDIDAAYTVRVHRDPLSREWRVPLSILERLTHLRATHPLRHPQPAQNQTIHN
jgi:hypothetical protein